MQSSQGFDVNVEMERLLQAASENQPSNEDHASSTNIDTMARLDRESLFNEAEKLYLSGHRQESVSIYIKCLKNLDAQSTFPSLPRCLRALANHFLEMREYIKSIHFVQAERLYYESALLDTAALQQKLIEMAATNSSFCETINSSSKLEKFEKQKSMTCLDEYEQMREYFVEMKKLSMALECAQKIVTLNLNLHGPDHISTKESLCKVHDLEVAIRRSSCAKSELNLINSYSPAANAMSTVCNDGERNEKQFLISHSSRIHNELSSTESQNEFHRSDISLSSTGLRDKMSFRKEFSNAMKLTFTLSKNIVKFGVGITLFVMLTIIVLSIVNDLIYVLFHGSSDGDRKIQALTSPLRNILDNILISMYNVAEKIEEYWL